MESWIVITRVILWLGGQTVDYLDEAPPFLFAQIKIFGQKGQIKNPNSGRKVERFTHSMGVVTRVALLNRWPNKVFFFSFEQVGKCGGQCRLIGRA